MNKVEIHTSDLKHHNTSPSSLLDTRYPHARCPQHLGHVPSLDTAHAPLQSAQHALTQRITHRLDKAAHNLFLKRAPRLPPFLLASRQARLTLLAQTAYL